MDTQAEDTLLGMDSIPLVVDIAGLAVGQVQTNHSFLSSWHQL